MTDMAIAPKDLSTSNKGIDLIKEFEGCRLKAYRCPAGIWTIGYGHTTAAGPPAVLPGMVITQDRAEEILRTDLGQFERAIGRYVKVDLTQHQFDALVSFAYNVGIGSMILSEPPGLARSTLLKRVNAGRFDDVPAEFMKWTRGGGRELPGLVRRRRAEAGLWRGVDKDGAQSLSETRFTPDVPQSKRTIIQSKEANGAAIAGGAGTIAVIQEVVPIIKDGGDLLSSLSPTVIALLVVVLAAAAVWYFRKQRLEEDGA